MKMIRLKYLRLINIKTQVLAADEMGVSVVTLNKWEKGKSKPSSDTFKNAVLIYCQRNYGYDGGFDELFEEISLS